MPIHNPAIDPVDYTKVALGKYTGNQTARQILTGFTCSFGIIMCLTGAEYKIIFMHPEPKSIAMAAALGDYTIIAWLHATDGFSLDNGILANKTGTEYYYWAISE